jgi:hypothetical protein
MPKKFRSELTVWCVRGDLSITLNRTQKSFPVRQYAVLVLLVACCSFSDAQAVPETIASSPSDPPILSAAEISKLFFHRLGSQLIPYYSSTRLSATATQFIAKWPMCFGTRRSIVLSSFCASGADPIKNESASSISVEVHAGANSAVTVFIISDDDQEGQVDRFWAAEASNGSVAVLANPPPLVIVDRDSAALRLSPD